jgi:hypothetical protein
MSSPKRS